MERAEYIFTETNSDSQKEFLEKKLQNRIADCKDPRYLLLANLLDDHVSNDYSIIVAEYEPTEDLTDLLSDKSQFFKTDLFKYKRIKGRVSQCHDNSVEYVCKKPEKRKLYTGYALSEDHLWRQHSWVIENNDTIVETTEKRLCYFGYEATRMLNEYLGIGESDIIDEESAWTFTPKTERI